MISSSEKKNLLSLLIPVVLTLILYGVYDFSLRSYVTFIIYVAIGILSVVLTFKLSVFKGPLTRFAIVFIFTYLSVYFFSLALGLNTSLFDFCKGVAFSFVSFSTCAMVRALVMGIEAKWLKKICSIISYVVLFAFVLLPSILICYFVATGSLISSDIIIALAQTNPTEGTEFVQSNFNIMWLLALIALTVIYTVNAFFYKDIESFDSRYFVTVLSFFLCLASSVWLALPRMDYLPFSIVKVTSKQLDNFEIYKQQKSQRLARLNKLDSLKLADSTDSDGNLFVLVIGESETRDRMQAYGFSRENTPYLCEQLKKQNNILFTNAYSSWPQTVQALSYSLTESNQYQKKQTVDAYSIIEIARASGFDTYWISNQRKYGVYETPITVISSTANHEVWVNGSSKMEGVFFDEEIINRFPKIDEKKNIFVVIHLMGSHQKYDKRLPGEFMKFEGNDDALDYYDDTVLYTDYILDKIYSKVKDKSNFKAMIYFSDHGEDPHVVGGHDPVNLNGQMLRIPLVVYLSDKYVQDNQSIYEALLQNREKFFSNDLIFDLVVRVMGITGIPDMENHLNLADKSYSLDKQSVLTMYGKMHLNEIPEKQN